MLSEYEKKINIYRKVVDCFVALRAPRNDNFYLYEPGIRAIGNLHQLSTFYFQRNNLR